MNAFDQASGALATCENELRQVAATAMGKGDYTAARSVLSLAEAVSELRSRPDICPDTSQSTGVGASGSRASPNQNAVRVGASGRGGRSGDAAGSSRAARRTKRQAYPKFIRRGDRLVKVGWSKSQKREYEHKAPQHAVFAFAHHLRNNTRDGKIFKVEPLLPVPDNQDGGELPAYQAYLALAWLRDAGLVEKRGRDGYSASHADLTDKKITQQWNVLTSEDT